MKAQLIATALFATVTSAFAADSWLTNLEEAKTKAAAENKPILIEFTGSDWCPPCKMLQKNVFSTETFSSQAPEKFVLVEMDYPRDKTGLTKEVEDYRRSVATTYEVTGFPTILLTDAKGKPLARTGFRGGDATAYLAHLDELLAEAKTETAAFEKAHTLEGQAKAKALIDLLAEKPAGDVANFYQAEVAAIKASDPKDSLGFVKNQQDQAAFKELMASLETFASQDKWAEVDGEVDKFLGRDALAVELRQEGLMLKAQLNFFKLEKKDVALKNIDAAIKLGDSTVPGRKAQQFKAHIESQQSK